jgi:hypothetical protein
MPGFLFRRYGEFTLHRVMREAHKGATDMGAEQLVVRTAISRRYLAALLRRNINIPAQRRINCVNMLIFSENIVISM